MKKAQCREYRYFSYTTRALTLLCQEFLKLRSSKQGWKFLWCFFIFYFYFIFIFLILGLVWGEGVPEKKPFTGFNGRRFGWWFFNKSGRWKWITSDNLKYIRKLIHFFITFFQFLYTFVIRTYLSGLPSHHKGTTIKVSSFLRVRAFLVYCNSQIRQFDVEMEGWGRFTSNEVYIFYVFVLKVEVLPSLEV
jgi:hypothetical protein